MHLYLVKTCIFNLFYESRATRNNEIPICKSLIRSNTDIEFHLVYVLIRKFVRDECETKGKDLILIIIPVSHTKSN